MTVLKGHFDGEKIVLDEPVPPGLAANTPVKVVVETEPRSLFDRILGLAVKDDGLPPDFSEQHEHYVKGAPRR